MITKTSVFPGYIGYSNNFRPTLYISDIYCRLLDKIRKNIFIVENITCATQLDLIPDDAILVVGLLGEYHPSEKLYKFISSRKYPSFVINPWISDQNNFCVEFLHYDSKFINNDWINFNNREYLLSCLSNRHEPHRLLIASVVNKYYKDKSFCTFNLGYENIIWSKETWYEKVKEKIDYDIPEWLLGSIDAILNNEKQVYNYDLNDQWKFSQPIANSFFNLTQESVFQTMSDFNYPVNYFYPYLTEKTLKPLSTGTFPIAVGQANTYNRLKRCGFGGFDIFNTQFDCIGDDSCRLEMLINIVANELDYDMHQLEHVCRKNYEWYYNEFFDQVSETNKLEICRLSEAINNI